MRRGINKEKREGERESSEGVCGERKTGNKITNTQMNWQKKILKSKYQRVRNRIRLIKVKQKKRK